MNSTKIKLRETGHFSAFFIDYIEGNPGLKDFYGLKPDLHNFKDQIAQKYFAANDRKILTDSLFLQYRSIDIPPAVERNISGLINENTFTVTTGHQLNIFSGPLYFHYKIITTINLAYKLKKLYPDYNFVPVYWMASEDHDYKEISHFNLFGKQYIWETDQQGAVGRFDPKSIKTLIDELPEKPDLFISAYLEHNTLADATRCYVNKLYGSQGLVVLDADCQTLKNKFKNIMKDDLLHHNAGNLVKNTTDKLVSLGYRPQAFPREINLFYLDDNLRERIVKDDGKYIVKNTSTVFTEIEILSLLDKHPEKFSPNVILRPVYQEQILPNLAYIGGPAEVSYWIQLKSVFDHHKIAFPILVPRNFAMFLNNATTKRMKKLGIKPEELFLNKKSLKNIYLKQHSSGSSEIPKEKQMILDAFGNIKTKAGTIDQSLEGFAGAEMSKVLKSLENIEKRLQKAEEKKQETGLKQLEQLKERLFPESNLQERTDNFLSFWLNDLSFLYKLQQALEPLDSHFYILFDDE